MSKLLGYNFLVEYKHDKENIVVDDLSRRNEDSEVNLFIVTVISVLQLERLKELKQKYLKYKLFYKGGRERS